MGGRNVNEFDAKAREIFPSSGPLSGDAFYEGPAGFVWTQKLPEGRPLARRRKRRYEENARDVTGSDTPSRIACTHTHKTRGMREKQYYQPRVHCRPRTRARLENKIGKWLV